MSEQQLNDRIDDCAIYCNEKWENEDIGAYCDAYTVITDNQVFTMDYYSEEEYYDGEPSNANVFEFYGQEGDILKPENLGRVMNFIDLDEDIQEAITKLIS